LSRFVFKPGGARLVSTYEAGTGQWTHMDAAGDQPLDSSELT
jgi:hypothetical protein